MSIVRAARKSQFHILPADVIADDRLSWEARGMLVYLLSKPDHWQVRAQELLARTRNCLGRRSGRDKVYSILRELQMAGYIVRRFNRQGGVFQGVSYEVAEIPDLEAGLAFIQALEKGTAEPITDSPETVVPDTPAPDMAPPFTAEAERIVINKQAVTIKKAVKNLTAAPSSESVPGADQPNAQDPEAPDQLPANYPKSPKSRSFSTWMAYATAFKTRYRHWPVYNATVGGQLTKMIDRVGADAAPITIRYYVEAVETPAIVDNHHPIRALLHHCESYVVKAQEHEIQRVRRAASEKAVRLAETAKAVTAPAVVPGKKPELNETAKQARETLGNLMGGILKSRMTA